VKDSQDHACSNCRQARGDVVKDIIHIHEEDFVVLPGGAVRIMTERIRALMYYYSYNSQGSDYICVFCQNRGRGNDDQIEHEDDCEGEKFLKILEG
jgi:hypothetical protein